MRYQRVIKIVLMISMVVSFVGLPLSAYYVFISDGCAYRIIGINNNLSSEFQDAFDNAIEAWNDGLESRSLRETSSGAGSIVDINFFEGDNTDGLGFLFDDRLHSSGLYKPWVMNPSVCCDNHQTTSFHIYINTYLCPPSSDEVYMQNIMVHELGHALGLGDFDTYANRDHIMNYATPDTVCVPAEEEYAAANSIWNH